MMKQSLGVVLCILVFACPVPGQGPKVPSPPIAERSTPDNLRRLLARWERQCASNRAIEARFTLVKSYPAWDLVERFEASAVLARPDKLYVNLVAVDPSGAASRREFHHRIIGTGRRLYLVMNRTRQVVVVDSGASGGEGLIQSDLIALLFDLKADAVVKRYQVELVKETPQSYVLQFTPRASVVTADFHRLDVMLDRESLLPTNLRLVATNGKDTQLFKFTRVVPNPIVSDATFQPPELKGWSVVDMSSPDFPTARPASGPLPPPVYSEVASPSSAGERTP
jgi:hypothetical protein